MRTPVKAGVTGSAMATATLLIVTAPTASGEHQSGSSAYGVSVGGTPGEPTVASDGAPIQTAGEQLPAQLGPLASGGVLTLSAGNDRATATITDLTLGQAIAPLNAAIDQIPGIGEVVELPATATATTFCTGLLDADVLSLAKIGTLQAECNDTAGTVTLTDVETLGAPQPLLVGAVAPEPQLLPAELADVATITLNHQTLDGENFTVEGLRLEVGGEEVAVLASATCGGPMAHPADVKSEQAQPSKEPKPAPAPTPVQASTPVTG